MLQDGGTDDIPGAVEASWAILARRTEDFGEMASDSYAEGWAAKVEALDRAGVVIARDLDGLAAAARSALTRAMQPA